MPESPTPRLRSGRWKAAASLLALAMFSAAAQAPGDLRLALIIGNAAYPEPNTLINPSRDARAMSEVLRGLGFSVINLQDGNRAQMAAAITQVRDALKGRKGVGLFYYAGHGVQHDWRNFMVPIDARLQRSTDIPSATVDVSQVLDAFKEAGNRLNLVILDACRDNPFDNQLATKGLAPVDAPPGTFMAFATAPGNVADDGDEKSENGLYTRHLLAELKRQDSRIEDVFTRVKLQVQQSSRGRQIPSESTNLAEDFSFDKGFLATDGARRAARIEHFAAEKVAWDRVKNSAQPGDFYAFLQRFPNGFVSEVARFRLSQLEKSPLMAQQRRDGVTTLPSGVNRYALGDQYTLVTTDLLTQVSRREPQKVTLATDTRVEINDGASVYNQLGGLLRDNSGDKDPPLLLVPTDIAPGKKWISAFQNSVAGFNIQGAVDFRTVAFEDVTIQGETMKAYRVTMEGLLGRLMLTGTVWIEPKSMRMVRWDRVLRAGPTVLEAARIEVTEYRAASRS